MKIKAKIYVKMLNYRKNDIDLKSFDPKIWVKGVTSLITRMFPDTYEIKINQLKAINFIINDRQAGKSAQLAFLKQSKAEAKKYIDMWIDEITKVGLETPKNICSCPLPSVFVRLICNPIFWTVLMAIISSSFFIGNHFGKTGLDKEKIECEKTNIMLLDSVKQLSDSIKFKNSILQTTKDSTGGKSKKLSK